MHIAVLRLLRRDVARERQKHLERMATGVANEEYQRLCGRAMEGKKFLEHLEALESRLARNGDIDEEDEANG